VHASVLHLIKIDDIFYSEVAARFRFNLIYLRQKLLNQVLIYLNYLILSVSFRLNRIMNSTLMLRYNVKSWFIGQLIYHAQAW
jgi:hypothetical protein